MIPTLWLAGGCLALYVFGRWVGDPPALRWLMPGVLFGALGFFAFLVITAQRMTGG